MSIAVLPPDEPARIQALQALHILDTAPEERFDRITRVAAKFFDVPIVLVSLVDVNRQWFKSCYGLDLAETGRDVSFCVYAILQSEVLVVPDALADARFASNPLVTGAPFIRFYAGQPLTSLDGHRVGTLCIIDQKTREMSTADLAVLKDLAKWAESELNTMELSRALGLLRAANQRLEGLLKVQEQYLSIITHDFRTALTGIQGFSEMIGLEDLTIDEIREFGRDINEDARRLNQMITKMVNLRHSGIEIDPGEPQD